MTGEDRNRLMRMSIEDAYAWLQQLRAQKRAFQTERRRIDNELAATEGDLLVVNDEIINRMLIIDVEEVTLTTGKRLYIADDVHVHVPKPDVPKLSRVAVKAFETGQAFEKEGVTVRPRMVVRERPEESDHEK